MRSIIALTILSIAGLPAAQDSPYTIDPQTVSTSDRQTWCDNQKAACPLICLQQPGVETLSTISNDCDPDNLTYTCVCSNNVSPNVTEYTQTLPYYICTEWGNQCVKNCNGDAACGNSCRADHPCGASDPPKGNSSRLSTTMSPTATPGPSDSSNSIPISGFAGATGTGSPNSNNKGAASSMLDLGHSYGLAVVFAGVFAGFAIIM